LSDDGAGVAAAELEVAFLPPQPMPDIVSVLTKVIIRTNTSSFFTAKPSFQEAKQGIPYVPRHPGLARASSHARAKLQQKSAEKHMGDHQ